LLKKNRFYELENINFLRDFLAEPNRYLRRLAAEDEPAEE